MISSDTKKKKKILEKIGIMSFSVDMIMSGGFHDFIRYKKKKKRSYRK